MKAVILNSGMGTRMGVLTSEQPKCMTEISYKETILSRQLNMLLKAGIEDVVITTGYYDNVLVNYCQSLELPLNITFVKNPDFSETNYIYSIYCAREYLEGDILLIHGDMVIENSVLEDVMNMEHSCMTVSSTSCLPEKDFKAVLNNGRICSIGIEFFSEAVSAQPFYKLLEKDWKVWLDRIVLFCQSGNRKCYAENAFNEVSKQCHIYPLDVKNRLCNEIDNTKDLAIVSNRLHEIENKMVYMSFSTDILHGGHIAIIQKAQKLGKLIIGVLSDEAIASYKRYPLLPYEDRKAMFESIAGVYKVVQQKTLSYKENLGKFRPDYVVHGDDWKIGFQKPIRDEVTSILASYGGTLVEYPYAGDQKYRELEARAKSELSMPDMRRKRLRREIGIKGLITAMEAHDGLSGLIVENTVVHQNGGGHQFDAIWVSSLCDSTERGKPDIELVDMTSRFRTIEDLMEVTTKPIIFDGDTGGKTEHFIYTVRSLERMGVSMIIIEDKTGLKKNSLFGTDVVQLQDSIENFCEKISAGKQAQKTREFMICARIESLILEQGVEDALERADAYVKAGADAIMIHSRRKEPDEIFDFVEKFRKSDKHTPIVVVPTSFNSVTEEEFKKRGINVVIYANQLMRATVPAIRKAAETILENHRAMECDNMLMPFSEIIRLIPEKI
ncbi:MAG: phosphoenolpyruvate mutase [Lachnospiraceae bacterium]|jgi:phosphoenolpyruvate mutase|nr:phosphoenolpyruvate mutase [Lachnospiraceae bacterium]